MTHQKWCIVQQIEGLLNIHVIGIGSNVGTIEQKEKSRGEKKAVLAMKKVMEEFNYAGGKVRIDHSFNLEAAQQLKDLILSAFPNADIVIGENYGLCSFYAERGGLIAGFEG